MPSRTPRTIACHSFRDRGPGRGNWGRERLVYVCRADVSDPPFAFMCRVVMYQAYLCMLICFRT
jgi:hypothetical protein